MNEEFAPVETTKPMSNHKYIIGVLIVLWYFFSVITLFLNKHIISEYKDADPVLLGMIQLWCCWGLGYFHMNSSCGMFRRTIGDKYPPKFYSNILIVGGLRYSTVLLGLVSLWYVPVSFAETVKSSAPVFTVVLAGIMLGERTTWPVISSLIVVMAGLALCSATDLSFNTPGFMAAIATNFSECLQNVYSKKLLSGDKHKFSPPELQTYTAMGSLWVQLPAVFFLTSYPQSWKVLFLLVLCGVSFNCQSFTEYILLGYISPITHSVANTVKRAIMIWLSVITFGNNVTFMSKLGTVIVILGVLLYNKTRQWMFVPPPSILQSVRTV